MRTSSQLGVRFPKIGMTWSGAAARTRRVPDIA